MVDAGGVFVEWLNIDSTQLARCLDSKQLAVCRNHSKPVSSRGAITKALMAWIGHRGLTVSGVHCRPSFFLDFDSQFSSLLSPAEDSCPALTYLGWWQTFHAVRPTFFLGIAWQFLEIFLPVSPLIYSLSSWPSDSTSAAVTEVSTLVFLMLVWYWEIHWLLSYY